jgi:hypothetical protein
VPNLQTWQHSQTLISDRLTNHARVMQRPLDFKAIRFTMDLGWPYEYAYPAFQARTARRKGEQRCVRASLHQESHEAWHNLLV